MKKEITCPSCRETISSVELARLSLAESQRDTAIVFLCPLCQYRLGIQIDPVSVMAEGADRTAGLLKNACKS